MAEKYLIDTSIWVDLYENRKGYQSEPLGDFAFRLFTMIKAKQDKIVITDLTIRELEMNYSIEEINGMTKPFESILDKLVASKEQRDEAKKIAAERNVPKGDALHAILARDNQFILISRDKHFKQLTDMSEIAQGAHSFALAKSKPAISEHAQEHAPPFRAAVLDISKSHKPEDII